MPITKTPLSRNDLRTLGRIVQENRLSALEWLEDYSPRQYRFLYDAVPLSTVEEIPQDEEELGRWLLEQYPGSNNGKRRSRLRHLFAAGVLFFFVGGAYYMRSRTRVPPNEIRGALDYTMRQSDSTLLEDCAALRNGVISLGQWEIRVTNWIKLSHVAGAILAVGGMARISEADWDIVNRNINTQLDYLHKLATDIANGLPLDGNICRRMGMYLQSGRKTYHDIESVRMADRGFTEYANVLTPAEHCEGCLAETARGWVPLGELIPIGERDCMSNDKCYYAYRNPTTGEVDDRI